MRIQVLGNGGAINEGLPYSSFVVDGILLCETPPDIMLSLHKHAIEISSIKTVYISHLHGDHTFGLPFLHTCKMAGYRLTPSSGRTGWKWRPKAWLSVPLQPVIHVLDG
jgi:ribonuclease BN (tRNA processing enzyme)